jgi:cell division protein FtsX
VRWPFILEGIIVGVTSAVVASVALLGLGIGFGGGHSLALGVGLRFAVLVVAVLIIAGALLGSLGSFVGVRRSLAT